MGKRSYSRWLWVPVVALAGTLLTPWAIRTYWSIRAANPVRTGIQTARRLGCFSCHGDLGQAGIPNPGSSEGEVPAWSGGVWMMYVESDDQIRQYITNGISDARRDSPAARLSIERAAIHMPAYANLIDPKDLEDLVAAFKALAGMSLPPAESPARRGYELTRQWRCTSCHGPAGSGGLPNPGSFAGFVPGFYGADFEDLVRDRQEFDGWVLEGAIPRLASHPVARFFSKRQALSMPAYTAMRPEELDDLWAYVKWLDATGGGLDGAPTPSW